MAWTAPVDDILLAMAAADPAAASPEAVAERREILAAAARFAEARIAPLDQDGDRLGSRFENGRVVTPPGWAAAYRDWAADGWNGLALDPAHGGSGLPVAMGTASMEIVTGASMAFGTLPVLTQGAVACIARHAEPDLAARVLPALVAGRWTAAMNLTEPQAGSDLAGIRTRAEPAEDGTWRVTGQKCFITFAEHDMAETVVHLVLARTPDAPPGTRGLSLFLVPKHLTDADGRPTRPNGVVCTGLEHKLGIRASPTCSMVFEGATGRLVGERHRGLAGMFTMMNEARLATGLQGVAVGDRAMQAAAAYAAERRQGRAPDGGGEGPVPIDRHPDVRRMLGRGRALVAAARLLAHRAAAAIDAARAGDPEAEILADLLTPVVKAWCSEAGVEAASLAIQVHGGAGYVEETGVARHWRDARIAPIYEGTNSIQAIDLVGRKLARDGGAAMKTLARSLSADLDGVSLGETAALRLSGALDALAMAVDAVLAAREPDRLILATPLLTLAGLALAGGLLARAASTAARLPDLRPSLDPVALARIYADEFAAAAPSLAARMIAPAAATDDWAAMAAER